MKGNEREDAAYQSRNAKDEDLSPIGRWAFLIVVLLVGVAIVAFVLRGVFA